MTIGILALQGDVREHAEALGDVGVESRPVRRQGDLGGLSGIVLPGGESTTLSLLLESSGLFGPLGSALRDGLPVLGTCAGLVLLSSHVLYGRPDQRTFGVLDCTVRRNGYGRQRESFEQAVRVEGELAGGDMPAVFIRAPVLEALGPGVEVLARLPAAAAAAAADGAAVGASAAAAEEVVACRQGAAIATAFHPELTGDRRIHRLLARLAGDLKGSEYVGTLEMGHDQVPQGCG